MPMSHPELPDELQGSAQPRPESGDDRLAAIGQIVAKKRDEAVKARKESGIEQVWSDCEDAYLGIDDANRGEFAKARWAKPTSMSGPVTTNGTNQTENKSTAYVRLTTRYVDMGAAKICEIVLPIDDKAFSFSATPVPELIQWRDDPGQVIGADGQPVWLLRALGPGFTLLCFGEPPQGLAQGVAAPLGEGLRVLRIGHELHDPEGLLAQRLDARPHSAYLVRPDQHLCARWRRPSALAVQQALARATANALAS